MAFSFTVTRRLEYGGVKSVYGTFSNNSGSTGGTIETGLRTVENFLIQYIKNAVVANAPTVNAALATSGGKQIIEAGSPKGEVTIVTDADTNGFWRAEGM